MATKLGAIFIALFTLVSVAAKADSFTINQNGKTYTCTAEDGGGCHDQQGREECGDWQNAGPIKVHNPYYMCSDPANACADFFSYTRVCRTYDGCGNLTGSYTDSKEEGTGFMQDCKPCN